MDVLDKLEEKIEKRREPKVSPTPILDLVASKVRNRVIQVKELWRTSRT